MKSSLRAARLLMVREPFLEIGPGISRHKPTTIEGKASYKTFGRGKLLRSQEFYLSPRRF
jgi:hypothetical protein